MTVAAATSAAAAVARTGRTVTFVKLDSTPADSDKPWRGATDPRGTPDDTLVTKATFIPPSSGRALGLSSRYEDLMKKVEQIAIVAPGASSTKNLEEFQELLDSDDSRWKISFVEVLKPAEVRILYFVGVRR